MTQQKTEGVRVWVETFYQPDHSNPIYSEYLFAYRITIENKLDVPVKLLRRKWHIHEGTGLKRIVEGEGVVGQQPTIIPGGSYQYSSAANIKTDMGKMFGYYEMQDLYNHKKIIVQIPAFNLIAPFKMN